MKKRLMAILLSVGMISALWNGIAYAEESTSQMVEAQNETEVVIPTQGSSDYSNISVNGKYSGYLNVSDDVKQYQFTINKAGRVSLEFFHENLLDAGRYWIIRLYDAQTDERVYMESKGTDTNKTSTEVGLPAGTYYVKINSDDYESSWCYNYSDATYYLKVNYSASSKWETEGNDSFSTADAISTNTVYKGALQYNDDVDYYKFTLKKSGKVSLILTHKNLMNTDRYWVARIYDAQTTELVYMESVGTDTSKTSVQVGLPAGTYYVRINSDDYESSWCHNYSDATYSFKVNYQETATWEKESNGKYEESTKIALDTTYSGALQYSDDEDYYKFTLSSSGTVKLNFKHSPIEDEGRYWVIRLLNGKTEELLKIDSSGKGTSTNSKEIKLSAGTYYVKVNSDEKESWCHNYSNATYQLRVNYYFSNVQPVLKATSAGYNKIKLNWSKVDSATGYTIYRSTSKNGTYKAIKNVSASSSRKYTDSGLTAGKNYYYKVRAYRTISGKKYYGKYSVVTVAKPVPAKTSITSIKAGTKKAALTWKKQTGVSGYEVLMSTTKNSGYKVVKTIKGSTTVKYTKTGLKKGKTYYFKVRTYRTVNGKKVYGNSSAVKSVKITK